MSYVAGVLNLGYCFQRLGVAGSSAYSGDWLGAAANMGASGGLGAAYGATHIKALKDVFDTPRVKDLPVPTPTAVIDSTILTVSAADLLNGFGPPSRGSEFDDGADLSEKASRDLAGAATDGQRWVGDSSDAYGEANADLQELVLRLAELDRQTQGLVEHQASKVEQAHDVIALTLLGLAVAKGIALSLFLIPGIGPKLSLGWQIVASMAASATASAGELIALQSSAAIASQVTQLALDYGEVAAKARPSSGLGGVEAAGGVSEAELAVSGLSRGSSVARLAVLAGEGVPAGQRAALSAFVGFEGVANPGGASVAVEIPSLPGLAMPTMAQATELSGQFARFSGSASQQMNLVNQSMAQAQQFASMGQQGRVSALASSSTSGATGSDEPDSSKEAPNVNGVSEDGAALTGAASGVAVGGHAPVRGSVSGSGESQPTPAGVALHS